MCVFLDRHSVAATCRVLISTRLLSAITGAAYIVIAGLACYSLAHAEDGAFADPLDNPAIRITVADKSPMLAVAAAGKRFVAVGMRGVIVYSDDQGNSWKQATSPVQSDLTAVHFPTPEQGWAVGHDGVILHSADGGVNWKKQIDGRQAQAQFIEFYQRKVDAGEPAFAEYVEAERANFRSGPSLPYLGVWFENESVGYVVGSFGMIAATKDGGKTWVPWLERIDNKQYRNLNTVRGIGGDVYLVGERGTVYRLDHAKQYFTSVSTNYAGSFFGVVGGGNTLLAYGLRGTTYLSTDRAQSWRSINVRVGAAISDGDISPDGRTLLLVSAPGVVSLSDDGGESFHPVASVPPMTFTGVRWLTDDKAIFAGFEGVRVQKFR